MCGAEPHDDPAVDEFGETCPGSNATDEAKGAYLYLLSWHRSKNKIETTDWDEFGRQAKSAYVLRSRSDVTTEELVRHCNQKTEEVAPVIAKNIEEKEEFDVDIPHLTVPGKAPAPSGGLVVGTTPGSEDSSDYSMFVKSVDEPR